MYYNVHGVSFIQWKLYNELYNIIYMFKVFDYFKLNYFELFILAAIKLSLQ